MRSSSTAWILVRREDYWGWTRWGWSFPCHTDRTPVDTNGGTNHQQSINRPERAREVVADPPDVVVVVHQRVDGDLSKRLLPAAAAPIAAAVLLLLLAVLRRSSRCSRHRWLLLPRRRLLHLCVVMGLIGFK